MRERRTMGGSQHPWHPRLVAYACDCFCVPKRWVGKEHVSRAPCAPCAQGSTALSVGRRRSARIAHAVERAAPRRRSPIKTIKRELADVLKKAKRRDVDWVFIDTPANVSPSVVDAIRAARLAIIPCRPGLLDIDAVQETIDFCRQLDTPYVVVLNGAPPRRSGVESPVVTAARECLVELKVPVWGGQITHRVSFSLAVSRGEGVQEQDLDQSSSMEIARLWQAMEKSSTSSKAHASVRDAPGGCLAVRILLRRQRVKFPIASGLRGAVIASEAKQSTAWQRLDCFVAPLLAMTSNPRTTSGSLSRTDRSRRRS